MTLEDLFEHYKNAIERGDLDTQLEILRQLLSLKQQTGDVAGEIEVLRLLGNVYQEKGQLQKAHSYRVTAFQLAQDNPSQRSEEGFMWVCCDLGRSYIEVHDWVKAEDYTRQALKIEESRQDVRTRCILNINLQVIYVNTDRKEEAFRLSEDTLREAEHLRDHYVLGLQYLNLANFLLHDLELNTSHRHAKQALAHSELSKNIQLQMRAQSILGKIFRRARLLTGRIEYSAEAESHLQQTIASARSLGNLPLEADAETELADFWEFRHEPEKAIAHYQRALKLLEEIRAHLGYEEFQLTYFQSAQPIYEKFTEFLLRQGQSNSAFLSAEQLRSRLLLALMGEERSNTSLWEESQQQELMETLNEYGTSVLSQCFKSDASDQQRGFTVGLRSLFENEDGAGDSDGTLLDTTPVGEARQRFLRLYESQRVNRTNWQSQQSPPSIDSESARQLLGHDEALVSYVVTPKSIVIFVVTDQASHFQHLPYSHTEIADDIQELCESITSKDLALAAEVSYKLPGVPLPVSMQAVTQRLNSALEKLYALLIAPVLPVIEEKSHWLIVPYGPLHRLPWGALRGSGQYLVERHTVSLLPSGSLYAVLKKDVPQRTGEIFFFADPDADNEKLRLPATQREVQAGYETLQAGTYPFIGSEATKQEFMARAPHAQALHFACHHFFDASAPLLSFLKLAGDYGEKFLYAFEIAEMNLSLDLVILSACESARSRIATGDEQIGIVRSFFAAGTRSIISTLWSIEDDSAALLFTDFYKNACQYGLAWALAIAQRNMLGNPRYSSPYYWAPYVLSGVWDTPFTLERRENE